MLTVAKVNTKVFNQRSVSFLQTARLKDEYPSTQTNNLSSLWLKLKDTAMMASHQDHKV